MQAGLLPLVTIVETLDSNRYSPPRWRRLPPSPRFTERPSVPTPGSPKQWLSAECVPREAAGFSKEDRETLFLLVKTLSPREVLEGLRLARESFCSRSL